MTAPDPGGNSSAAWRSLRYAAAVLVTVIALLFRYLMTPEWGATLPFITLYPAVAFSAWLGGFGPGAVSTFLGAFSVAYFWPDHFGGASNAGDALALTLFCGVGVFVSGLTSALQQSRRRAEHVTEEVERAREVERTARAEAERANRAKDDFLAVVAHELRQPLSAMLPALTVIRAALDPEALARVERFLDLFQRQLAHLQRVVDDLLDASRVVRGQVTLERRAVDVLQVIRDAIDAIRPRVEQRHQRIIVDLPDRDVMLRADPVRLQQVFLNVLSNATAYTPKEGEIRVTAEANGSQLTLKVRDSGEGIAAADLPRIFGLFTRAEGRRDTGFGIGLAVARSLVELHGGTIEAQSDGPSRGSEFHITLPVT